MIGRIAELWRYPVKSLAGERVPVIELTSAGVVGDRRFAVRDSRSGLVLTCGRESRLLYAAARSRPQPDSPVDIHLPGLVAPIPDDAVDQALSAWLERPVRLISRTALEPETPAFYDYGFEVEATAADFGDTPGRIHLIGRTSLDWFAARGEPADARRTRPNIVLELGGVPFAEDRLTGQILRLGTALVRIEQPTARCALLDSGHPGQDPLPGTLAALRSDRAGNLGVYATIVRPGRIEEGAAASTTGADAT